MDLHNEIMNLKCQVPADANINQAIAWKNGHKQARHAAAEIAIAYDEEVEKLRTALVDLDSAFGFQPSCQAGAIPRCCCLDCVKERMNELLAPNA